LLKRHLDAIVAPYTPPPPLIPAERIAARVADLAAAIHADHADGVHLVGVLKGAFVFLADLARALPGPATVDFVAVASYGAGTTTSGSVRLLRDLDAGIAGRDVVVVEDIVDSGLTLTALLAHLRARGPRSLRTACLLDKPAGRRTMVAIDYVGFTIDDAFVVGYGLDHAEAWRHLAYIAIAGRPGA
jgi:hypoxanthine phosphoribosyltransferase